MKHLYSLLVLLLLCACGTEKENPEIAAQSTLQAARQLMITKQYDAARDSINHIRKAFPKAFKARTAGIVVMDSIELLMAQDSLAVLDSILNQEKALYDELRNRDNRGRNGEVTDQRVKVYNLEQQFDEMCAKVKFYLRKIEIDKATKYPSEQ